MVLTSILLSALAATAMAAPHGTATSMAAPHCTPDARVRPTFFEALNSSCSLPVSLKASPNLPLFGLPPPVNQSLEFIAVGRGIQVNFPSICLTRRTDLLCRTTHAQRDLTRPLQLLVPSRFCLTPAVFSNSTEACWRTWLILLSNIHSTILRPRCSHTTAPTSWATTSSATPPPLNSTSTPENTALATSTRRRRMPSTHRPRRRWARAESQRVRFNG